MCGFDNMSDTTALARVDGTYAFSFVSLYGVSSLHNHLLALTEACSSVGEDNEEGPSDSKRC